MAGRPLPYPDPKPMQRADRNRSPSVTEHVRNAETRLADGDPHAALAYLDIAFLATPDDPVVRWLRGRSLSMLGRRDAALAEIDAAIALNPNLADAWLDRSAIHLERSDWSAAESDASRALELNSSLPCAWRTRGIARYKLGSLVAAAADLNRALDRAPDDPLAHYWRGLARRDAGNNRAAIADFNAAIKLNERYTEAYVARGKAHSNLGDMAAARSDWAIAAQMLHQSH